MKMLLIFVLLPVALGPLPQPERVLVAATCYGGKIEIPLGDKDDEPSGDCHPQACHAGSCRERFDQDQGKPRA